MPKLKLNPALHPQLPGRPLVVMHGWGTDSFFTSPIASLFPTRPVLLLDLPGYGINYDLQQLSSDFEQSAAAVAEVLPQDCDLMAWSLSSLLAIKTCALSFRPVHTLITICGTPRFPADPNWPGFPFKLVLKLKRFFTPERANHMLRLFFAAQCAQKTIAPQVQSFLREGGTLQHQHAFETLKSELENMAQIDERMDLKNLSIPCLHIFGAEDRLIPSALSSKLKTGPNRFCLVFEHSAHMPFLTEPERFVREVEYFCSLKF